MAKTETYYWVDEKSTFGGGENPIRCNDELPEYFLKDPRFETLKKEGKISTEKVADRRVLSELEQLREENAQLKKGGASTGITQEQLDAAKAESVQADLDEIAKLKASDAGELQGKLDLISESLESIQQGDSKAEIWDAVKSVKDLLKDGE